MPRDQVGKVGVMVLRLNYVVSHSFGKIWVFGPTLLPEKRFLSPAGKNLRVRLSKVIADLFGDRYTLHRQGVGHLRR